VDPFVVVLMGTLGVLVIAVLLLGKYYPGSGADVLDWRPTRSPELEAQNEIDDIEQMLEANNERRRRRGERELTEADMQARVLEDRRLRAQMRERHLEQEDIRQMLEVANAGRRRRGKEPLTEEQLRADLGESARE
jgi:hypothetical protein